MTRQDLLLCSTIAFFVVGILNIDDLEEIPWNIVLLFGGAMSIGFCLWETGAAKWLAVNWLVLFEKAPAVVSSSVYGLLCSGDDQLHYERGRHRHLLPVALVIAPYLGVASEVILFSALATAGMPFFLLIGGAAPNAIAYNSKQFTPGEFLRYGLMASVMLMVVLWGFVAYIWPLMGMQVFAAVK